MLQISPSSYFLISTVHNPTFGLSKTACKIRWALALSPKLYVTQKPGRAKWRLTFIGYCNFVVLFMINSNKDISNCWKTIHYDVLLRVFLLSSVFCISATYKSRIFKSVSRVLIQGNMVEQDLMKKGFIQGLNSGKIWRVAYNIAFALMW